MKKVKEFKEKTTNFIRDNEKEIEIGAIAAVGTFLGFIFASRIYDSGYKNGCTETADYFVKTIGRFYRNGQVMFVEKGTNRILNWDAAGRIMFGNYD